MWPNPLKYFNNVSVAFLLSLPKYCLFVLFYQVVFLPFIAILILIFSFQEADEELEGEEGEEVISLFFPVM